MNRKLVCEPSVQEKCNQHKTERDRGRHDIASRWPSKDNTAIRANATITQRRRTRYRTSVCRKFGRYSTTIAAMASTGKTLKAAASDGRIIQTNPKAVQRTAQGKYQKLGAPNKSSRIANAPDRQKKRPRPTLTHRDSKNASRAIQARLCRKTGPNG